MDEKGGFAEPDNTPNTSTPTTENVEHDYKKEKYVALFQARTILSKAGTMAERRVCNTQLKKMKKLGKGYL